MNEYLYNDEDIGFYSINNERWFTYCGSRWLYAEYCKLTCDNKVLWYNLDGSISHAYDNLSWNMHNILRNVEAKTTKEIPNPFSA